MMPCPRDIEYVNYALDDKELRSLIAHGLCKAWFLSYRAHA